MRKASLRPINFYQGFGDTNIIAAGPKKAPNFCWRLWVDGLPLAVVPDCGPLVGGAAALVLLRGMRLGCA
jgi:hypothetical protein